MILYYVVVYMWWLSDKETTSITYHKQLCSKVAVLPRLAIRHINLVKTSYADFVEDQSRTQLEGVEDYSNSFTLIRTN